MPRSTPLVNTRGLQNRATTSTVQAAFTQLVNQLVDANDRERGVLGHEPSDYSVLYRSVHNLPADAELTGTHAQFGQAELRDDYWELKAMLLAMLTQRLSITLTQWWNSDRVDFVAQLAEVRAQRLLEQQSASDARHTLLGEEARPDVTPPRDREMAAILQLLGYGIIDHTHLDGVIYDFQGSSYGKGERAGWKWLGPPSVTAVAQWRRCYDECVRSGDGPYKDKGPTLQGRNARETAVNRKELAQAMNLVEHYAGERRKETADAEASVQQRAVDVLMGLGVLTAGDEARMAARQGHAEVRDVETWRRALAAKLDGWRRPSTCSERGRN